MSFIDELIEKKYLQTREIINAFRKIKRVDFLPDNLEKKLAELNEALPIGGGQTISQPLVVAFMLELLKPQRGDKILDIGSGSGWTNALLSQIVSEKGKVISLEIIPQLKDFGEKNVSKYSFIEKGISKFVCQDGKKGYKEEAPFDKILCSASIKNNEKLSIIDKIPQEWKNQLKIKGRIVTPIDSSIWLFIKKSEKEFQEIEYPGFIFVPLVNKKNV